MSAPLPSAKDHLLAALDLIGCAGREIASGNAKAADLALERAAAAIQAVLAMSA